MNGNIHYPNHFTKWFAEKQGTKQIWAYMKNQQCAHKSDVDHHPLHLNDARISIMYAYNYSALPSSLQSACLDRYPFYGSERMDEAIPIKDEAVSDARPRQSKDGHSGIG